MVCLKGEGGLVIHGPLRGEEADLWSGELRMSLDGLLGNRRRNGKRNQIIIVSGIDIVPGSPIASGGRGSCPLCRREGRARGLNKKLVLTQGRGIHCPVCCFVLLEVKRLEPGVKSQLSVDTEAIRGHSGFNTGFGEVVWRVPRGK